MSGWTAGSRDTSCLFWHKRRDRPLRSSWSLQWTRKGKRQPALWQQGVQALTGDIASSGVGVEQPKDVRMDKPIGANGTWLCHGVRGCGRERTCLCTGEEDCPGLLTARSSLPRLLGQHSDSTGRCRSQQSKGDLQPSSPPSSFTVCSPGKDTDHTWATVPWCFVSLQFGFFFHPAHIQCIWHELSSNISAPQVVGMLEEDGALVSQQQTFSPLNSHC